MTIYIFDNKTYKTKSFASRKQTQSYGNGFIVASTPTELANNDNTTLQKLVNIFNNLSGDQTKKFPDKITGAKRIFSKLLSIAPEKGWTPGMDEKLVSDSVPSKPKKVASQETTKGRFAGKMIRCNVTENPRREATKGFHSMGILINASGDIPYEEYIALGGRRQDLAWDLDKGYVLVEDKFND
jgi:hypothetical protein|tara:strand:+ start:4126 stop:4677 length:552 start_codon:yes stop_codon:yes gene_type:complete